MKTIADYYRSKYKDSLFVVKAGGRVITDGENRRTLLSNIKDLNQAGIKVLLIYGGGTAIDAALKNADIEVKKENGRRVTTADAIPHIQNVMAGDLGFRISRTMADISLNGLTLANIPPSWGKLAFRDRDNPDDYGFDGVFEAVFAEQVRNIFNGVMFVACPCTGVSDKSAVNINADNVAVALAKGVQARKLIFLSDVDGVMKDGEVLSLITDKDIPELIAEGTATGGMQVKLENCLDALKSGVKRIHLINGFEGDALIKEIYDAEGRGTMAVLEEDAQSYYNEMQTQLAIEKNA